MNGMSNLLLDETKTLNIRMIKHSIENSSIKRNNTKTKIHRVWISVSDSNQQHFQIVV